MGLLFCGPIFPCVGVSEYRSDGVINLRAWGKSIFRSDTVTPTPACHAHGVITSIHERIGHISYEMG